VFGWYGYRLNGQEKTNLPRMRKVWNSNPGRTDKNLNLIQTRRYAIGVYRVSCYNYWLGLAQLFRVDEIMRACCFQKYNTVELYGNAEESGKL